MDTDARLLPVERFMPSDGGTVGRQADAKRTPVVMPGYICVSDLSAILSAKVLKTMEILRKIWNRETLGMAL
jgi:hypothetical protein